MINMKKTNGLKKASLFLAFFLLNTALIGALGVSPASKTIDFQPNTNVELEFNIINSGKGNFDINLGASGDIVDLIFFEKNTITVNSTEFRIPFKAILKFPSEIEPGVHKGSIRINPIIPEFGDKMFAAYVAPQIPLYIRVPYPAKYLDVLIHVLEVDEGTPLPIYVVLDNLGSENITRAWAEIEVYDPKQDLIGELKTKEISLRNNSVREIQALPSLILKKGIYYAVVNAYYDEFTKILRTNFTIGEPVIRIKEVITKELAPDEINKVSFKVSNEWNTELSVNGFLEINQRKTEMPVFRIRAEGEREITGFFDTTGFMPGDYNMSLTLIYADQIKTHTFPITITEIALKPEKPPKNLLLVGGAVLILIVIIILLVLFIIKKRKSLRERNL